MDINSIQWAVISALGAIVLTLIGVIYGINTKKAENSEKQANNISEQLHGISLTITTLTSELKGGLSGLDRRIKDIELHNLHTRIAIVEEAMKYLHRS